MRRESFTSALTYDFQGALNVCIGLTTTLTGSANKYSQPLDICFTKFWLINSSSQTELQLRQSVQPFDSTGCSISQTKKLPLYQR
jgi:hypothetical protein